MITALPLFFREGDAAGMLDGTDQRALIVKSLEPDYALQAIDGFDGSTLSAFPVLLIIQPRALSPTELVTLDEWIRRGGRALFFADPELRWPSRYAFGDKRRAPPVTLLDPLLTHWGLTLDLGDAGTGEWHAEGDVCKVVDGGFRALCSIGKGRAELIADADLLDIEQSNDSAVALTKSILQRLSESRVKSNVIGNN